MNVDRVIGMFSAFNFRFRDNGINIKKQKILIFYVMANLVICGTVVNCQTCVFICKLL
jgi:hypothetical protein